MISSLRYVFHLQDCKFNIHFIFKSLKSMHMVYACMHIKKQSVPSFYESQIIRWNPRFYGKTFQSSLWNNRLKWIKVEILIFKP